MYAYALADVFDYHTYPYSQSHMCIYISHSTASGAPTFQPSRAVARPRHQSTGGALHYLAIVQVPHVWRTHIKAIAICSRGNGQPHFISTRLQRAAGLPSSETRSCNGCGRKLPIKPSYQDYTSRRSEKLYGYTVYPQSSTAFPQIVAARPRYRIKAGVPALPASCNAMQRAWKCSVWLAVTAAGCDIVCESCEQAVDGQH